MLFCHPTTHLIVHIPTVIVMIKKTKGEHLEVPIGKKALGNYRQNVINH